MLKSLNLNLDFSLIAPKIGVVFGGTGVNTNEITLWKQDFVNRVKKALSENNEVSISATANEESNSSKVRPISHKMSKKVEELFDLYKFSSLDYAPSVLGDFYYRHELAVRDQFHAWASKQPPRARDFPLPSDFPAIPEGEDIAHYRNPNPELRAVEEKYIREWSLPGFVIARWLKITIGGGWSLDAIKAKNYTALWVWGEPHMCKSLLLNAIETISHGSVYNMADRSPSSKFAPNWINNRYYMIRILAHESSFGNSNNAILTLPEFETILDMKPLAMHQKNLRTALSTGIQFSFIESNRKYTDCKNINKDKMNLKIFQKRLYAVKLKDRIKIFSMVNKLLETANKPQYNFDISSSIEDFENRDLD